MTLSAAADAYRAALAGHGDVVEFAIDALDRTGVPVWSAAVFAPDGAQLGNGVGYGDSEAEARVSALGETLEAVAGTAAVRALPRVRASFAELGPERAVDPRTLVLPAGTAWTPGTPMAWARARRWTGGDEVLVPVEWIAQAPGDLRADDPAPAVVPITNGMGAGDTRERALLHGVLELVQRDGNSVAYRALDRGIAVDVGGIGDEAVRRLLAHLDALGIDVLVKSAYDDLGMANVVVCGSDRDPADAAFPLTVTACGEAAHPDAERAVRKALLEFCSSRARKAFNHGPLDLLAPLADPRYLDRARRTSAAGEEERALEAMRDWLGRDATELRDLIADPVLAVHETVALGELPSVPGLAAAPAAEQLAVVVARLAAAGHEVLWVDLTPPGGDAHVVRAVVPGLEAETMSYHRVGPRNVRRLLARRVPWVGRGAPPAGALPLPLPEGEAPAWVDPAGLDAAVGGLYPLYREPSRHVTAVLQPS